MVECKNLIKIYFNRTTDLKTPALRGIELEIKSGEFVAVVGPSGAGKSTLLKILAGLEKPSGGQVKVGGKLLNAISDEELVDYHRRGVGIVWQDPLENVLTTEKAIDNILFPMRIAGVISREEMKDRAKSLLEAVNLSHRRNHRPTQLSGGEIQRLSLAVALANDPQLVLLDEPTGELDTETTNEIITLLQNLNKTYHKTMLIVTHDKRFEEKIKTVYKISDGLLLGLDVRREIGKEDLVTEQLGYVDEFGLIRLPLDHMRKVGIRNYVKIIPEDDQLVIIPAEPPQMEKELNDTSKE
jgi:ABC-type lipoprotein export system ATPase subunit